MDDPAQSAAHGPARRRTRSGIPLGIVTAASVAALLTRARGAGADLLVVVLLTVAAIAVAVLAVVVARRMQRTAARHAAVRARRRKAEVIEVRGAVGLRDALAAEGARRSTVRRRGATALSLAVSAEGLELWSGAAEPELVHSLRWPAVAAITEGTGAVGAARHRPALVLVTRTGNRLVLVPARRPGGALRAATAADVAALVARLEGMRGGSTDADLDRAREARRSGREARRRRLPRA